MPLPRNKKIVWYAKGGGVARMGPFETQVEACAALRLTEDRAPACFAKDAFTWPEQVFTSVKYRKPQNPLKVAESRVAELQEGLERLLTVAYQHICVHEETERGGVIWTLCRACGAKWADDEGGYKPSPAVAVFEDIEKILARRR